MKLNPPDPELKAAFSAKARALYRDQLYALYKDELTALVRVPASEDFRATQGRAQVLEALINQLDKWSP